MAIAHKPDDNDPPELGRLGDTHILWRITGWGASAAVALAIAVLITQTDSGAQRLRLAFAPQATEPAQSIAQADLEMPSATAKLAETQRLETQRLEAQLRALAADRDRLNARIVSLEQNLNDMTGSIKRQLALVAATAPTPPPVISPPTTTTTTPPPTANETTKTAVNVKAQSADGETTSRAEFQSSVGTRPEAKTQGRLEPVVETPGKNAAATPDKQSQNPATSLAGAAVPLPPVRVASAPVSEPVAAAKRKTELGVDLGGARSMDILHARWIALKANFGPLLEGLHPLVAHDRRPNAIPFRLLVGPLPNGAAAAQVCARFAASRVTCRTTRFVGEALARQ